MERKCSSSKGGETCAWNYFLFPFSLSVTHRETHKYIFTGNLTVNVSCLVLVQQMLGKCFQLFNTHIQRPAWSSFVTHCCVLSTGKPPGHSYSHTNSHTADKIITIHPPKSVTDLMYEAWSLKKSHRGFLFSHSSPSFRPFSLSSSRSDFSWMTKQTEEIDVRGGYKTRSK